MTRPIAEQEEQDRLRAQGLKRCTKCKNVKSLSEFGSRPKNRDGLESSCRACRCEAVKFRNKQIKDGTWDDTLAKREAERKARPHKERGKKEVSEFNRRHYLKHHEEHLERARAWRLAHPDKVREARRNWERNNSEKKRAARKRYAAAHPDRVKQQALQTRLRRRAKDPVGVATQRANRYAKHCRVPGKCTKEQWLKLLELCGNCCVKCGSTEKLTRDHIIPLDWPEGTHFVTNLQPMCLSCNASKHHLYAADYRPLPARAWAYLETYGTVEEFDEQAELEWWVKLQVLEMGVEAISSITPT